MIAVEHSVSMLHAHFEFRCKLLNVFGVPGGIRTRVTAVKDKLDMEFQQLAEHGWRLRTAQE